MGSARCLQSTVAHGLGLAHLMTVVATTGRAVSCGSSGSSGIGISAVSRCGTCNYGKINDLHKTPPRNFKTGPFDRSGTSPLQCAASSRRLFLLLPAPAVHTIFVSQVSGSVAPDDPEMKENGRPAGTARR